jgi:hypothetical protein
MGVSVSGKGGDGGRTGPHLRAWVAAAPLVAALLVSGATVAAAWTGYLAKGEAFDWVVAATVGTAIGTTLLALATGGLAVVSFNELRTTRRLAEYQERDEKRKDKAWVLVQGADLMFPHKDSRGAFAVVDVTNAGGGPAVNVVVDVALFDSRADRAPSRVLLSYTITAIMPGGTQPAQILCDPPLKLSDSEIDRIGICVRFHDRTTPPDGPARPLPVFWDWRDPLSGSVPTAGNGSQARARHEDATRPRRVARARPRVMTRASLSSRAA